MNSRTLLLVSLALTCAGCLSKTPAPNVRWFVSERIPFAPLTEEEHRPLRLAAVNGRAHLKEAMVWRLSPVELFFDEQERWSAQPAALVQNALHDALFTTGPFVSSDSRDAIELRVDLFAFEGIYAERDLAVCEIGVVHDDGKLIRQRTFRALSPLQSREPEELARSLGRALHEVALEIREWARTSG